MAGNVYFCEVRSAENRMVLSVQRSFTALPEQLALKLESARHDYHSLTPKGNAGFVNVARLYITNGEIHPPRAIRSPAELTISRRLETSLWLSTSQVMDPPTRVTSVLRMILRRGRSKNP